MIEVSLLLKRRPKLTRFVAPYLPLSSSPIPYFRANLITLQEAPELRAKNECILHKSKYLRDPRLFGL